MAVRPLLALAAACALSALPLTALPISADPPPEGPGGGGGAASPYGATYTEAELAALDRALHAGNMTRQDLTFRKDMAKGTYCLPLVKAMLKDPLLIASKTDELVASLSRLSPADPAPS